MEFLNRMKIGEVFDVVVYDKKRMYGEGYIFRKSENLYYLNIEFDFGLKICGDYPGDVVIEIFEPYEVDVK